MINLLKTREQKLIDKLSNQLTSGMVESVSALQNEIMISFPARVIAITSLDNDNISSLFGKIFSESFSTCGENTLIIDAILNNPFLRNLFEFTTENDSAIVTENYTQLPISKTLSMICFNKSFYSALSLSKDIIGHIINSNNNSFSRFVILIPSVIKRSDILLFKGIIDSVILVTAKSITKKKEVFDAIRFFDTNNLPLAKVVLLK